MKKYILLLIILFGNLSAVLAQNLDQYRYVQVPQRYDFLSEADQFQLNSLTAFLFEKYGFEVFYGSNLAEGIPACDILRANVDKDKALFSTKLTVTLEDCKGQTVFTSKMGKSREKEYKIAYHEALRDAFTSFDELNFTYSETPVNVAQTTPEDAEPEIEIVETTPEVLEESLEVEKSVTQKQVAEKALPVVVEQKVTSGTRNFRNGATRYTLKSTGTGFELFKADETSTFATLLKSGSGSNYIYASKAVQGSAYFDADGNLLVEYLDANTGQLVTVKYGKE